MKERPDFVTQIDIQRWDEQIKNDPLFPVEQIFKLNVSMKETFYEVCYAGCYLTEQLKLLQCPDEIIVRIQYTAGQNSFGNDPWIIHLELLEQYKTGNLKLEDDERHSIFN